MAIPIPKPSILDQHEAIGAPSGRKRWRSKDGRRLFEWDELHGEIEVYTKKGFHIGAMTPQGEMKENSVIKGRKIDVS